MKIVISGASGLIGTQLVAKLSQGGHEVIRLVRRSPKSGEIQWNPKSGTLDAAALEGADAVIHLSGAGIGDKRWTAGYRKEILDSRTDTTALLAKQSHHSRASLQYFFQVPLSEFTEHVTTSSSPK